MFHLDSITLGELTWPRRMWSWGCGVLATLKSRIEAPKAPRGLGCGEWVSPSPQKIFEFLTWKWCILVDSDTVEPGARSIFCSWWCRQWITPSSCHGGVGLHPQKIFEFFFNFCMEDPEIYNPLWWYMHVHKNGQTSLIASPGIPNFRLRKIWICKISTWMNLHMQKIHKFTPNAATVNKLDHRCYAAETHWGNASAWSGKWNNV